MTRPLGNWLFALPVLLIFFVLATHNEQIIAAEVRGVDSIDAGGTRIGVRFETKPGVYRYVIREYLRRVKKAFDRQGLELGMPQQGMTYRRELESKDAMDSSILWKSQNDLECEGG
ncbi:mechanosensitive ion channel family protein [Roseofilum reptotaenium CS-1145]|uniref:mechanosensitive ion channel family protein n=1 Tax=Roseofilum reptotaenium TaxID=1233427 RepID=UPI000AD6422A|nr:mechanosensitive ion channel family protein [Roseofilum reptotaenium]MDB9517571.1 mechanosensitive ion channel family protein [Roseofilum reptotaenium CS-1145]